MTQKEFTQRTLVDISAIEFEAINVVYNCSDLDKDEFCAMWCKMNASRVRIAKQRKAIEEEKTQRIDSLIGLIYTYKYGEHDNWSDLANGVMTKKEIRICESNGIDVTEEETLSNILFLVRKRVNTMIGEYNA